MKLPAPQCNLVLHSHKGKTAIQNFKNLENPIYDSSIHRSGPKFQTVRKSINQENTQFSIINLLICPQSTSTVTNFLFSYF